MPENATLALGQPEIANINLVAKTIVITGKKAGSTNLIMLDPAGEEVFRAYIQVGGGLQINARLYDGTVRDQSYVCTPLSCTPAPPVTTLPSRLGDYAPTPF
jgi:Pilus formation protein N terminal region